jgi:hypothetical protein
MIPFFENGETGGYDPTEIDLTKSGSAAKNGMSETCQFNAAVYHN